MENELLHHLTNLVRHSNIVIFKIPTEVFNEKYSESTRNKEIADAWTYIKNEMNLQIYKHKQEENLITVRVKVKKTEGVLWGWQ